MATPTRQTLILKSLRKQFPIRRGFCSGCLKALPRGRQRWCSDACANNYNALVDTQVARRKLFAKDPLCAICREPLWVELEWGDLGVMTGDWGVAAIGFACDVRTRRRVYAEERRPEQRDAELDHVVPVSEGGEHHWNNFRLLCRPCHLDVTREMHERKAKARRASP